MCGVCVCARVCERACVRVCGGMFVRRQYVREQGPRIVFMRHDKEERG